MELGFCIVPTTFALLGRAISMAGSVAPAVHHAATQYKYLTHRHLALTHTCDWGQLATGKETILPKASWWAIWRRLRFIAAANYRSFRFLGGFEICGCLWRFPAAKAIGL